MPFDGPARYTATAAESLGVTDPQAIDPATRHIGAIANLVSQVHDRPPEERAASLPYIERGVQTLEVALAAAKAMVAENIPEMDVDPPAVKAKKKPKKAKEPEKEAEKEAEKEPATLPRPSPIGPFPAPGAPTQ